MLILTILTLVVYGQYDSYYDADGDLIPIEDLIPTQLVTTFDPPASNNADRKKEEEKEEEKESKFTLVYPFGNLNQLSMER